MTEQKKEIIVYIAEDGKEFLSKAECVGYEDELILSKERAEYLSYELSKLLNEMNEDTRIQYRVIVSHLNHRTVIEESFEGNEYEEPDEDFCYDFDQFIKFEKEAKKRYLYEVNTPSYYWGK